MKIMMLTGAMCLFVCLFFLYMDFEKGPQQRSSCIPIGANTDIRYHRIRYYVFRPSTIPIHRVLVLHVDPCYSYSPFHPLTDSEHVQ